MLKIVSVLLMTMVVSMAGYVSAQENKEECPNGDKMKCEMKMEQMHKSRLEKLVKELGLTEGQKQKIEDIIKDGWGKTREEMKKVHEQAKNMRKEVDSKIEQVLTPEQLEKFKQLREKMCNKIKKSAVKEKKNMKRKEMDNK